MDILGFGEGGLAVNQVLETDSDLPTVVKVGVDDGRGVDGEEHAVKECVSGGEIQRRICLVGSLVKETVLVDGLQDLVETPSVVEHTVGVDGNVGGVPSIGVPDGEDDGEGEKGPEEDVEGSVERVDEGVTSHNALVPIPSGEGVQPQTTVGTGDSSQADILWSDPGGPVEVGHSSDEVVGEPEIDEHGDEAVGKPPHPGHGPPVRGGVCFRVESPVQCDSGQVRRPDSPRRVDEETTGKTSETVANEVGRKGNEDLVAKAASPCLIEVDGEVLHPDDESSVRGSEPDISHDGDNHVLLHVELARVEAPRVTESGEFFLGEGNLE